MQSDHNEIHHGAVLNEVMTRSTAAVYCETSSTTSSRVLDIASALRDLETVRPEEIFDSGLSSGNSRVRSSRSSRSDRRRQKDISLDGNTQVSTSNDTWDSDSDSDRDDDSSGNSSLTPESYDDSLIMVVNKGAAEVEVDDEDEVERIKAQARALWRKRVGVLIHSAAAKKNANDQ
jgi:hypothetical protein